MIKKISTLILTLVVALSFSASCWAAQSPVTKRVHPTTKKHRNHGNSGRKGDKEKNPNGGGGRNGENDNGRNGQGGNNPGGDGGSGYDNSSTSPKTGYSYEAAGVLIALITGSGVVLVSRRRKEN